MHPTVLLVDDDPHVTTALARALHEAPFSVQFCASGHDALAMLARAPVHVLIANEKMPGMSGSELLAVVRRRYPETIRIMLTGQLHEATVPATRDGDAHRFFVKPLDVDELSRAISEALATQAQQPPVLRTPPAVETSPPRRRRSKSRPAD